MIIGPQQSCEIERILRSLARLIPWRALALVASTSLAVHPRLGAIDGLAGRRRAHRPSRQDDLLFVNDHGNDNENQYKCSVITP